MRRSDHEQGPRSRRGVIILRRLLSVGLLALPTVVGAPPATAAGGVLPLFDQAPDPLEDWAVQRFEGETRYRALPGDRGPVVEARSRGAASGRVRELEVDPGHHRWLAWSWSVDAPVPVADVRERAGDDFAARVYVVFSGGWARWRSTSLVYVWAPEGAPAEPWPNPFTGQAMMIAATRGSATRGPATRGSATGDSTMRTDPDGRIWVDVRRDLVADYRLAFGREPPEIVAVAIMTDTDQTGAEARARYADLRLLSGDVTAPPSSD